MVKLKLAGPIASPAKKNTARARPSLAVLNGINALKLVKPTESPLQPLQPLARPVVQAEPPKLEVCHSYFFVREAKINPGSSPTDRCGPLPIRSKVGGFYPI
jgi:hypothetical protein